MNEVKVGFGHHLIYFFCWLIAMVLGFLDLVSVRELILSVFALIDLDLKVVGLLDKLGFFGFGVIGLTVIILTEGYFRSGVSSGNLFERVCLIFGVQLLCLFVFEGGRLVIPGIVDVARPSIIPTVMNLTIGLLCLAVWRRKCQIRLGGL